MHGQKETTAAMIGHTDTQIWSKKTFFAFLIALQISIILFIQLRVSSKYKDNAGNFYREPKYSSLCKNHSQSKTLSSCKSPERLFRFLDEHPIYSTFKIPNPKSKTDVNLLIIVSSAPLRIDRRSGIRDTWWRFCKSSPRITVKCIFMTDSPNPSTEVGKNLLEEKETYQDLAFQTLHGGVEFGKRFLYHMLWAKKNYNFDYFMRMDDDYFFCLDRFLLEIPMPVRKLYHWGFVHCLPRIVRPEESIILLSHDLVEKFLDQDSNCMMGHPWADQMIATWVQDLNLSALYNHDKRLHHSPVLKHLKNIPKMFKDVCNNFIGVHGSYPKYMRLLWTLRRKNKKNVGSLDKYSVKCNFPQVFDWREFGNIWKYEPKRLIDNPTWDTSKQNGNKAEYGGRQEDQG